jgi:hypothetical protein
MTMARMKGGIMSRRWLITAAAGAGLVAGFLSALAIGNVRAQPFPEVQVWTEGDLAFFRPNPTDRSFAIYIDPLSAAEPSVFRIPTPGGPVGVPSRGVAELTVFEIRGVYTFDPRTFRWKECGPWEACDAPPRDLGLAGASLMVSGTFDFGENTQPKCSDTKDNDLDDKVDGADPDCERFISPSPSPSSSLN